MNAIFTLAKKDIVLLLRDKGGLFWVIGFPLLMALFFGAIFGGFGESSMSSVKIHVVDEDNSEYSKKFIEKLSALDMLDIKQTTLDSASELVRKGKTTAFIRLKKGLEDAQNSFSSNSSFIELGLDPSKRFSSQLIQGMITKTSFELMMDVFSNPAGMLGNIQKDLSTIDTSTTIDPEEKKKVKKFFAGLEGFIEGFDTSFMKQESIMQGPKVETVNISRESMGPQNSYEITFPSAILWALIGCTSAFAVSIVSEKTRGTYVRLRNAPISRAQILAGKGLACFVTIISVSMLLLIFAKLVFDVRLNHPVHLAIALGSSAICFVGLMMFISVLGKTEQAVGGGGMAIMLIMSMTGGGMIPLFVMPKWMITVSNFSFVKWGIISLEGAIWRNYSYSEMMLPVAVLIGSGIVLFFIGVTILTKRDA